MMARRKHLGMSWGFYWIREREGQRWEPAELVDHGGCLKMMVLGYDRGIPIDEIYEWDVEIRPLPHEEFGEEKD